MNKEDIKNKIYRLRRYPAQNTNPFTRVFDPFKNTVDLDEVINIIDEQDEPEITEEPKYYVLNKENYFILAKDPGDDFVFSTGGNTRLGDTKATAASFRLTEQEIKGYDPRYWAFKVPVEETEQDEE